jgi:hypothetical protein
MHREDQWDEAHDLFVAYDGSIFYMSRDGADNTYRAFGVPKEIEAVWLEALTAERLRQLGEPGNWRVLNFLWQHSDPMHLAEVVEAEPLGKVWERRAFVQRTLRRQAGACRESPDRPPPGHRRGKEAAR